MCVWCTAARGGAIGTGDDVAAVLLVWFPDQEFGNALADALFGETEPGGRLPTTWPASDENVPVLSTRPVAGHLSYTEGLHIGYRAWLRSGASPAYPFDHGLGYTIWRYESLDAPATAHADEGRQRHRAGTRTGRRPGKEVVQVYLASRNPWSNAPSCGWPDLAHRARRLRTRAGRSVADLPLTRTITVRP